MTSVSSSEAVGNQLQIAPSEGLTAALDELRLLEGSPAELAARTGELVARYDRRWQVAHNAGEPVEPHIVDFLTAVLLHVDTLMSTGQIQEAATTILFGLLSTDISKADRLRFSALWLRALHTCALILVSLPDAFPQPGFADHLDTCARYSLALFCHAYATGGATGTPESFGQLYRQVVQSGMLESLPPLHGEAPDPENCPGEIIIDIFTRLRACGIATV